MFDFNRPVLFTLQVLGVLLLIGVLFYPSQKVMCEVIGGSWYSPEYKVSSWSLPEYQCVMPFSDAGNECYDSSECLGNCLAPEHTARGQSTSGICAKWSILINKCEKQVVKGFVEREVCE